MNTHDKTAHRVRAVIAGTGSYLPARVMTNEDFTKIVDTSDEWIRTRTGIRERRIAAPEEAASDLAAKAGARALEAAGLAATEVDLIIVATVTPDHLLPSTACLVQRALGAERAFCFDLEAACSGFIYGSEVARVFIESGRVRHALVIGAEKMSTIVDWTDRQTCVLFGDGAGAVLWSRADDGRGLLATAMGCDGRLADLLVVPAGGSRKPASAETVAAREHSIRMSGREVFRHAVVNMSQAAREAIERAGCTLDAIDWVIPHQANQRIIEAIAERLGLPMERFYLNLERTGNMSGASIPVALDEAVRAGRIRPGDRILTVAFGSGLTWGASVIQL